MCPLKSTVQSADLPELLLDFWYKAHLVTIFIHENVRNSLIIVICLFILRSLFSDLPNQEGKKYGIGFAKLSLPQVKIC